MTMTLYEATECRQAQYELAKATKILGEISHRDIAMCEELYLEIEVIRSCHEMLLRVSDNLYAKSKARIDAEE